MYRLILLFVLIIGSSLAYLNLSHYIKAPGTNEQAVRLIIPRGYSVKEIAYELTDSNLIKYPRIFWLTHRFFFAECPLQAGEYEFPPHSSVENIINMTNEGQVIAHKFTVTEGTTTKEITDDIITETMLIGNISREFNEGDFLADTYYYTYGETKMMLLNRMYKQSQALLDELWIKRIPNLPLANKQEAVILASIIEKETGLASERRRIAGVFINRLRKNIKLQADPTVIYAITQGKYIFNRRITRSDLKIKSLYNTYLYYGLPPTAIGNPSKVAVEAVLNPLQTNELYFVATGNGGHNFSSSLTEHNDNVSKYRKIRRKAKENAQ